MSDPVSFAFNQDELNSLVNNQAVDTVVFSLRNFIIPTTGKPDMFVCTQALDVQKNLITNETPNFGCPYPPGWDDYGLTVLHSDLQGAIKFSIPKADLSKVVAHNRFIFGPRAIPQVVAYLEGEETDPTVRTTVLSIKCLQADGSTNGVLPVNAAPYLQ